MKKENLAVPMPPPLPKKSGEAISPPKDFDLKKSIEEWREEEKKLRKIYLEAPERTQFFEYDFVEVLWMHMIEYYGKAVGDDAIEEMIYRILEDDRLWQMVYDVAQEYASGQDWEMII